MSIFVTTVMTAGDTCPLRQITLPIVSDLKEFLEGEDGRGTPALPCHASGLGVVKSREERGVTPAWEGALPL